MDRLICGDVGFGKTEVALRAIFCVVSAGKQAMVLAPTIVLAKQHYDVISQRFSLYPQIKVGLLSRFQVFIHTTVFFFAYGKTSDLPQSHVRHCADQSREGGVFGNDKTRSSQYHCRYSLPSRKPCCVQQSRPSCRR